jgi:4-aminobutyrate aminotransferase/(S)-3-amino-2-methylpropionate transaminase
MNRTQKVLRQLRDYESPNILAIAPDLSAPMVWEHARGVQVWDAAGRKYLDLTAAFGVAAAGHANPRVVAAGRRQMGRLLHAMGDIYPHAGKAALARELSRVTFERWTAKGTLRNPGVEWAARPSQRRPAPAGEGAQTWAKTWRREFRSPIWSPVGGSPTGIGGSPVPPDPEGAGSPRPGLTGKTIFANSGFEAVEAALKTALLATGEPRILAFAGGYHGLGYGALNGTHRDFFRGPFKTQLAEFGSFVPFPSNDGDLGRLESTIRKLHRARPFGAILVEPVQARGGIHVPPACFLPMLRGLCDHCGALLILDEIYTGFGRTGKWFACEHSATVPDLICLGKALTGGFPLSACVGRADVMDAAWPRSCGEAIHTSTFLGHPVGCAMALAQIQEIQARRLPERCAKLGALLLAELRTQTPPPGCQVEIRGIGLMAGVEILQPDGTPGTAAAMGVLQDMLRAGFIVLPEGEHSNIISFTPPLTITRPQLAAAAHAFHQALRSVSDT